jgi:Domain of unknown function (DUF4145)
MDAQPRGWPHRRGHRCVPVVRIYDPLMATPQQWVGTCPYCSASPAPFALGRSSHQLDRQGANVGGSLRRVRPVAVRLSSNKIRSSRVNIAMHPRAIGEWDVSHLPAGVEVIWNEAVKAYRVGAYPSAVVACGRTLEQAALERNVEGRTLQQRIEKMRTDGLITTEFKDAMDYIRLIRNVGAHAGKEVSRESAEGTMRFTQQTLRLLFEVPTELDRLTAHPPELDEAEQD